MVTKFNINETVMVPMTVGSIQILNNGDVFYTLALPRDKEGIILESEGCYDYCGSEMLLQYREDYIKAAKKKEGTE